MFSIIIITVIFLELTAGVPMCHVNEEWHQCGTECPATCLTLFQPRSCSDVCVSGCFCQKGYVKSAEDGPCVSEMACNILPPVPVCAENEEYSECATICPQACIEDKSALCSDVCLQECVCKAGFIRSFKNGPCISRQSCPTAVV